MRDGSLQLGFAQGELESLRSEVAASQEAYMACAREGGGSFGVWGVLIPHTLTLMWGVGPLVGVARGWGRVGCGFPGHGPRCRSFGGQIGGRRLVGSLVSDKRRCIERMRFCALATVCCMNMS